MIIIEHRINTLNQLRHVNPENGVEIDLRSNVVTGKIYIQHDPMKQGTNFEDWLAVYIEQKIKGPIIFNTKEDGLEGLIIETCQQAGIHNFFFLDTTIPTLVKWSLLQKERRFAYRISAYERVETSNAFSGKVEWIWADCFNGIPLNLSDIMRLKKDFKICLVSPELHGCDEIHPDFQPLLNVVDAICTKKPQFWLDNCRDNYGYSSTKRECK